MTAGRGGRRRALCGVLAVVWVCAVGGLAAGEDPAEIPAQTVIAFHDAIRSNYTQRVIDLLKEHPTLATYKPPSDPELPLALALSCGVDAQIVQALVANGADVQQLIAGNSIVFEALRHTGHSAETANYLIAKGANLTFVPDRGETLLHWAAQWGDATTIDLLADRGFDLNAVDDHGLTPLMWATNSSNTVTFVRLIERGAAVIHGKNGNSLHHFLLICANSSSRPPVAEQAAVVKKLIALGCDPNELDETNLTPLMLAMDLFRYGDQELQLVEALLENGADPNMEITARSLLAWAARMESGELVQVLLDHGADPWKRDGNGETALEAVLPAATGRSMFWMLGRLDANSRWRPQRGAMVKILYNAQVGPVDLCALAALLVLTVAVGIWVRRWVTLQSGHLHGAGAEAALDRISARADWKELLHRYEAALAMQRRVFLHRPWVLIGAIGWVGGVALMVFDPVLNLLVEPGAWWLAWTFTGTFLLGCGLQFAGRSAWRILGAAVGIVTLAVSCFYAGVAVYLVWVYPQLYLLAVTLGAMVLATLTAAWRFHRTLKAEIALRRIQLPPELALAREALDGAEIEVREGWDSGGDGERMKHEGNPTADRSDG